MTAYAHFRRLARCTKVVSLYEALPVKRFFMPSTFFRLRLAVTLTASASLCIHGNGSPFCLGRAERSTLACP
jgi:hypothetical protein